MVNFRVACHIVLPRGTGHGARRARRRKAERERPAGP